MAVDLPTDRTDGGAFLYLFSRFLFVVVLGCVVVIAGGVVAGVSLPPSASLPSGLGRVRGPVKSRENVMSYYICEHVEKGNFRPTQETHR